MKANRFFRNVWRINALLILLAATAAPKPVASIAFQKLGESELQIPQLR
jgi:hypothetical protein